MTSTNIQDQILLNQLVTNGVYTSGGILIPQPSPLTSSFAVAVANAAIQIPPILSYTGNVSGYDFATNQAALIENLNKLVSLTITGEVASAFNDVVLCIPSITIVGGLNDAFNRSKVASNITITGNVLSSFDNSILKGVSTKRCHHGSLSVTGNVGIDVSSQLVIDLENFVYSFTPGVAPATTPTVAQFQTALTTAYNGIIAGVASQFTARITIIFNQIVLNLPTPSSQLYTSTIQASVLINFTYNLNNAQSFVYTTLKYDNITFVGTYSFMSFVSIRVEVKNLSVTFSNAVSIFTSVSINGFETQEAPQNKFGICKWRPACKVLFNLTNSASFTISVVGTILFNSIIEADHFTFTGNYFGQLIFGNKITANKIDVNSTVAVGSVGILGNSYLTAFKCINVSFPLGVVSGLLVDTTVNFGEMNLNGQFTLINPRNLNGHKFTLQGVAAFIGNSLLVNDLNVDYIIIGDLYQAGLIFPNTLITAKEVIFKSDFSSSTSLLHNAIVKADKVKFENGLLYPTTVPQSIKFEVEELIVEKCPGLVSNTIASPTILSLAFNGSIIEANKVIIKGDISQSFNASTLNVKEFVAGNSTFCFASSLLDVESLKFEVAAAQGPSAICGKVPAILNLDTTNTTQLTTVKSIIVNALYLLRPSPTQIPLDTNFAIERLSSSTFDRSALSLIFQPKFINLDITVNQLVPYGLPSLSYPSTQFLSDAIIGYLEATIVNGNTESIPVNLPFSKLQFLKLVGTATVSGIPISVLQSLKEISICTTTPPTEDDKRLLRKYGLRI
ncbi:MAG: hypothetical protein Solivirus1_19 [Solivirus sp.]|uniref:Uncharacterized protein n=1 Tax=Solivirus sp. TaxID=2487772 RepID=A0A3G5AFA9_9VIRU|nr:MAG: hypothetical protein Solivirus1_19 [Solivirus sp.]